MKSKYIIVKRGNLETPFIFPETETHSAVAMSLTRGSPGALESVVSAGFCDVGYDEELGYVAWCCWGESISLKIKSLDTDSSTLNRMFRVNPY